MPEASTLKKTVRKKKEEPPESPVPDLLSFPGLDMPEIKSALPEYTREPVPDFAPDFEDDESEPPAPETDRSIRRDRPDWHRNRADWLDKETGQ